MNIGILEMEGVFEKNEKYNNFIFSNKNKILKVNEEVVLFKDCEDNRGINNILEEKEEEKNMSDNSGSRSMSDSDTDNGWNVFAKNTKFGILMGFIKEFEKTLTEIKLKNILRFVLIKKNMHGKLLDSIPEYRILEKKKILIVYKIYKSFTEYESRDASRKVNYDILRVNDVFVQTIIVEILLLVILSIFNKQLAYRSLKLIIKSEYKENIEMQTKLSYHLKMILNMDILYLVGLYFDLYLHLQEMKVETNIIDGYDETHLGHNREYSNLNTVSFEKRKFSVVENKITNKINKYSNINSSTLTPELHDNLEMDEVFSKVNEIIKRNSESSKIFLKCDTSTIITRKNFINTNIINFIEKDLKNFKKVMNITQHVHDFLIIKKYDSQIMQNSYYEYKIFLEIRNYLFENMNKIPEMNQIFYGHSNKAYYEHRIQKLNYDYYLGDNKIKGSNLLYKEMIVKVKKRHEKKEKNKEDVSYGRLKESESSRGISHSMDSISQVSPIIKSMKNFGKFNLEKPSKEYYETGKGNIRASVINIEPTKFLANLLPYKSTEESNGSSPKLSNPSKENINLVKDTDILTIKYNPSETKNTFLTESYYPSPEKQAPSAFNIEIMARENFFDAMLNKKNKLKINKKLINTNKVDINDANIPKSPQNFNCTKLQELFKCRTRNQYLTPKNDRNHPGSIIYLKNETEGSVDSTRSLFITPLPHLTPKVKLKKNINNNGEFIMKSKKE
jgi:hypothetical protein